MSARTPTLSTSNNEVKDWAALASQAIENLDDQIEYNINRLGMKLRAALEHLNPSIITQFELRYENFQNASRELLDLGRDELRRQSPGERLREAQKVDYHTANRSNTSQPSLLELPVCRFTFQNETDLDRVRSLTSSDLLVLLHQASVSPWNDVISAVVKADRLYLTLSTIEAEELMWSENWRAARLLQLSGELYYFTDKYQVEVHSFNATDVNEEMWPDPNLFIARWGIDNNVEIYRAYWLFKTSLVLVLKDQGDAEYLCKYCVNLSGIIGEVRPTYGRALKTKQCRNCWGWCQHGDMCRNPPKCARDSQGHHTKKCPKKLPLKCPSCGGPHIAWSRDCLDLTVQAMWKQILRLREQGPPWAANLLRELSNTSQSTTRNTSGASRTWNRPRTTPAISAQGHTTSSTSRTATTVPSQTGEVSRKRQRQHADNDGPGREKQVRSVSETISEERPEDSVAAASSLVNAQRRPPDDKDMNCDDDDEFEPSPDEKDLLMQVAANSPDISRRKRTERSSKKTVGPKAGPKVAQSSSEGKKKVERPRKNASANTAQASVSQDSLSLPCSSQAPASQALGDTNTPRPSRLPRPSKDLTGPYTRLETVQLSRNGNKKVGRPPKNPTDITQVPASQDSLSSPPSSQGPPSSPPSSLPLSQAPLSTPPSSPPSSSQTVPSSAPSSQTSLSQASPVSPSSSRNLRSRAKNGTAASANDNSKKKVTTKNMFDDANIKRALGN